MLHVTLVPLDEYVIGKKVRGVREEGAGRRSSEHRGGK